MKSKYDVVFESMTPKEAAEFTKGDPEKMKFMKQIKDQKNMETYVKNTTANNQNPGTFKKLVDLDKTLEKYEDDYVNQRGKQTLAPRS